MFQGCFTCVVLCFIFNDSHFLVKDDLLVGCSVFLTLFKPFKDVFENCIPLSVNIVCILNGNILYTSFKKSIAVFFVCSLYNL